MTFEAPRAWQAVAWGPAPYADAVPPQLGDVPGSAAHRAHPSSCSTSFTPVCAARGPAN